MSKSLTKIVLTLVVLALVTACTQGQSVARSKWNMGSARTFTNTLSFEADADKGLKELDLEIDVRLSQGEVAFVAINPDGEKVWADNTQDKLKVRKTYEPIPGTWVLEITVTNAKGSIETIWTGKK